MVLVYFTQHPVTLEGRGTLHHHQARIDGIGIREATHDAVHLHKNLIVGHERHLGTDLGTGLLVHLPDELCALGAHLGAHALNRLPPLRTLLRVRDGKAHVLEPLFRLPPSHEPGERHVDIERLERDALLLLRPQGRERLDVVQTVGELDENDAQVVIRHEQHLPERGNLPVRDPALIQTLAHLRHSLHQTSHRLSELTLNLVECRVAVFDGIVQKCCDEHVFLRLQLGQIQRCRDGVRHIIVTRHPLLPGVILDGAS